LQEKSKVPPNTFISRVCVNTSPPCRNRCAEFLRRCVLQFARRAPGAEENISYGIPTYKLNGPLIHWAAFKNHASLIGVEKGLLKHFAAELKPFKTAGSTIRFTAENPLPAALVKKIVKYRVAQNLLLQKKRETMKSSKKQIGAKK
jgi:uncharacterized protein YdhG (YjbR/CyaY superfamily)